MKTYAEMQLLHAPKAFPSRSALLQYLLVLFAFGMVFALATVSLIKVQNLERKLTELEDMVEELRAATKAPVDADASPQVQKGDSKDCLYADYESDYKDDDTSVDNSVDNYSEEKLSNMFDNDAPYGFSIGDVLMEGNEEIQSLEISRMKRELGDENYEGITSELNGDEELNSNIRRKRHRRDELPNRKHHGRKSAIVAVHFSGYTPADHPHVKPEGHIRHPNYTYVDWRESTWSKRHSNNYFKMSSGVLEVMESGLYFIYAQINFLTPHDSAGFQILKNERNILSCMVTSLTHASHHRPDKSNTCYTAGAEHLEIGDKIIVRDFSDYSYSKFEIGKSFFGAIRLTSL